MTSNRSRRMSACVLTLALLPVLCAAARRGSRDQWQQPRRVLVDLGIKAGDEVADIGAGPGYFSLPMAKIVGDKGKIHATEISTKAIKPLVDRIKKDGIKNIQTVISEPTSTKLADNSVDAAIIVNVLHHVPKEQRGDLVKDIVRSIRPGGSLYIIDWRVDAKVSYDKNRRIPKADLVKLGTDAGLTLDAEYYYLVHQVFLRLRKAPAAK